MRDAVTGVCSECTSPPAAYHRRLCSQFRGYYCHRCEGTYFGDYCLDCPPPWWVSEVAL